MVAKLALPITRFNIMRPANCTSYRLGFERLPWFFHHSAACKPAAKSRRSKSLGKATPVSRNCANLPRRSAMIWLSSCGHLLRSIFGHNLNALFQAGLNKLIQIAVQHFLGIANFHVGTQVLDARLVEHIGANLVAPADIGFGVFELVLLACACAVRLRTCAISACDMASARFLCCERSFWHCTTMPVGMCVMRTAESVLLMC